MSPRSAQDYGPDEDLALIVALARAAGAKAQVLRRAGLTTEFKSDRTPVSSADLAVDALLKGELMAARPDYGWLSEETVDDPDRLKRRRVFVVDPIDGTRAFIKDKPWWVVSIGVVENGRPVAAAVFAPDLDESFEALSGKGARLNGAVIQASRTDRIEDCGMLADAQMLRHPAWPEPWPEMRIASRNSIAYRLCAVASGTYDATLALSSKSEWDLAAADLIATEAGCVVTDHQGQGIAYNRVVPTTRSLVCAGPALHELILRRVKPIQLPN
ncbi:MAG: 3'(2'),5'-bisphosphate nucleotidase CysQ [Caulobacteraceae bacterium]|nr:3'(2'),5'-bisphosphate nucleotidase CysQ [Caulobacteraceae bacterium]